MKKYIAHYGIAITLFFTSIASAMDHYCAMNVIAQLKKLDYFSFHEYIQKMSTDDYFSLIRAPATEHNNNLPLITMPKDVSRLIWNQFVDCNDSIEKNINHILSLSATCTHFNNRLEEFGNLLKCYNNETKNTLIQNHYPLFPKSKADKNAHYWNTRRSVLLLVYAGANHNNCWLLSPLLERAVKQDDSDMIYILFQYGANANIIPISYPLFFQIKNLKMAQLFAKSGANFNVLKKTISGPMNVLWTTLFQKKLNSMLIQFYLDQGVNPRFLNHKKRSILHIMFYRSFSDDNPELINALRLLLINIGHMINVIDYKGKTALDLLIEKSSQNKPNIIALFKRYGAKTSQELKQAELQ